MKRRNSSASTFSPATAALARGGRRRLARGMRLNSGHGLSLARAVSSWPSSKQNDHANSVTEAGGKKRNEAGRCGLMSMQVLLDGQLCERKAWHRRRGQVNEPITSAARLQKYFGDQIRHKAFDVHSGKGIRVVAQTQKEEAAERTEELMETDGVNYIANAHFCNQDLHASCDLLERGDDGGWNVGVVRAAKAKNIHAKVKQTLAFVRRVAEARGHRIQKAFVLAPRAEYQRGADTEDSLLQRLDLTEAVDADYGHVRADIERIDRLTSLDRAPKASPIPHCSKCAMFKKCFGREAEGSVWDLPRISRRKLEELLKDGSSEIEEVTDKRLTTAQRRHWEAVRKGGLVVDHKGLSEDLGTAEGPPFFYLDFEHINAAMPVFDGASPFELTVFQFSLHRCEVFPPPPAPEIGLSSAEAGLTHVDFLSDGSQASLESLCEKLLDSIGDKGSVFVYSASEASQLRHLQGRYPHLRDGLANVQQRLFDLERTIRGNLAHPGFRGRTSLKCVLPVLVPRYENTYEELIVGDGAGAILAFDRTIDPTTSSLEREQLRDALLKYCGMDTLALVELHRYLVNVAAQTGYR